jgi:two-component sensor histidine kinase
MAKRLQATTVSKYYVDEIMHSIGDILLVTDREGRIRSANRKAVELLGWTEDDLIGRHVADVISDRIGDGELSVIARDGSHLPVVCTPAPLRNASGELQGEVWVAQDVGHLKRIEGELRALLAEKEVLLREVHHRVKNNLQVISSLLHLQGSNATDESTLRRFEEAETRVRSMALIHEQLYRSDDLTRVDFRVYVERLVANVLASTGAPGGNVALAVDVEAVPLDLDIAIPCGLILNELVTNAIKHAFPDGRRGTVRVGFTSSAGHATLCVSDDGVGLLPAGRVDGRATLGLRLVHALVHQLEGRLQIDGSSGTRVTLAFPTGQPGREADAVVSPP